MDYETISAFIFLFKRKYTSREEDKSKLERLNSDDVEMQLLLIHANYLKFEAKQKTSVAEEVSEEQKSGRVEETLVVFAAVEKEDESDPENIAINASNEIEEIYNQVEAKSVVLYPYAHLSRSLASPKVSIEILDRIRDELKKKEVEVWRLPFGWYKSFELSCKGHPLSELSRTITAEAPEEEPEKIPSEYLILTPDGKEHKLDLQKLEECKILESHPILESFIRSEELGEKVSKEPPHIKLMRRQEIADYEPASDKGHLRFYPKGAFIREMLVELAGQLANEIGACKIETPILYKVDEPDIREQASRFLQKDYTIDLPSKTLLMRFAGDFGLFRIMKGTTMSYKQLPIRIYELTSSYRLEQSGECVGLKRLRAFTMPDLHSFCLDLDQGSEEYERLFKMYAQLLEDMEIDYVVVFRVVENYFRENKELITRLLKDLERPALIELLMERKHYWVMKHEFQAIDAVGGNGQLSTVQLDLEDSERYRIFYFDEKGEKRGCIILHSSMGSIERWMYALLEEAAKQIDRGEAPTLPLWLAPTQLRLIPVSENHVEFCKELAGKIRGKVRVDIDDRDETVPKKVRSAEREWIHYIMVLGDRELDSEEFPVRIRGSEEDRKMSLGELVNEVEEKTEGMPFESLPLPELLSLRPTFSGEVR